MSRDAYLQWLEWVVDVNFGMPGGKQRQAWENLHLHDDCRAEAAGFECREPRMDIPGLNGGAWDNPGRSIDVSD